MASRVKFLYDEHLDNLNTTVRVLNTADNNDVVLKAFYQDDFHISITNQWNSGDSTIIKSLVDSAASLITGRTGKMVGEFANWGLSKINPQTEEGMKLKADAQALVNKAGEYQNSHIFSADDFYKTFKGTSVTFPLNLQVQLLSDEKKPKIDIYEKLRKILSVSIGDYESSGLGFIGIQHAPNGFKSGTLNLATDALLDGTLKVIYGDPNKGGYSLDNMVISNVQATFSKIKVETEKNKFRPLSIDLQIMLEPGRKFTKTDLERNLGMPRGSLKTSKNLVLKSGKRPKEETEDSLARQRHIQAAAVKQEEASIFEVWEDAFFELPGINYRIEDGVLMFYGEMDSDQYDELQVAFDSFDLSKYDSVNKISSANITVNNV